MFVESPAEPGGETDFVHEALISFGGMLSEGTPGTFSNRFEMGNHEGEALMVLRNHDLCEHAEYNGGNEKRLHRSANGFHPLHHVQGAGMQRSHHTGPL